jgi:hypothetical protein
MTLSLLAVTFAAFLWAKLEVHTEGKHGWAAKLPTWRIEKHVLLDLFLGGRPLTGYHFWAFSFVLFIFHLPCFWLQTWSWLGEGRIIGSVLLFWVIEDFLWFIINPHYGWRRYNPREIPWHPKWILGFPADHWALLILSVLLIAWSYGKV